MRRPLLPLLLAVLAGFATACGSSSGNLDGEVESAVVAQNQGRQVVRAVSCTDQAPAPKPVPGGGVVKAEHTCTITFSDGRPTEVWAVHVLDLVLKDQAQLLYRIDHHGQGGAPATAHLAKSFSGQMAVLKGAAVSHVHCVAARPDVPASAAALPPPDHVCSARVAGHGRQRWAVHTVGSGALLLFQLG